MTTLEIDGSAATDITGFYAEINRLFMTGEDWTIGHSLDALHDVLGGGYVPTADGAAVTVIWNDSDVSREGLGIPSTVAWLEAKIAQPEVFDVARFSRELEEVRAGRGTTYFDRILEVFADNPHVTLELR